MLQVDPLGSASGWKLGDCASQVSSVS